MSAYTHEEFDADTTLLDLVGEFGAEEVSAGWRARMRKQHPDVGGSDEAAKRLNVAKDRLLAWVGAGKPALAGEPVPPKPRKRWRDWRPPPILQDTHHVFGVSVVLLFGGFLAVCILIQAAWDYGLEPLDALLPKIQIDPDRVILGLGFSLMLLGIAARAVSVAHGKYKRDIARECPACKKKNVLRKMADIHQYSDWHRHESTVGYGKDEHKETSYSTTHHFSAFYHCDDCGHEFQHNYTRFVMNTSSVNRPQDFLMGILRTTLQV